MSFYRYFLYLKTAILGLWKSLKRPWILSFHFAMNRVQCSWTSSFSLFLIRTSLVLGQFFSSILSGQCAFVTFLGRTDLLMHMISHIPTHFSLAWYVCGLSHSCLLLKTFNGFKYCSVCTLYEFQWHIVLDGGP